MPHRRPEHREARRLEMTYPGWRVEYRARDGQYAAQVDSVPDAPIYTSPTPEGLAREMRQHDQLRTGIRVLLAL